jgi:hypothetical protein
MKPSNIFGLISICLLGCVVSYEIGAAPNFVTSVFGRTGAITAQFGDYSFSKISGQFDPSQMPSGGLCASCANLSTVGSLTTGEGTNSPSVFILTDGFGSVTQLRVVRGTPEGVVIGNPGDLCLRTDGSTGSSFYVKESGTGNIGWRAK